jgi:hypothetical protein
MVNTRAGYCWQENASTPPQTTLNPQAEKIERNVEKLGIGHQITAVLSSGEEYHGTITNIGAESFLVAERDLGQVVTINYHETRKVYKNYYHKDLLVGRNPHKQLILGGAILTFLVVGLAYGIAHRSQ